MSHMKCSDVAYLAYLQTYNSPFCLSKNIDDDGIALIKPVLVGELLCLFDEVMFVGESKEYFPMQLNADNYFREIEAKFTIPLPNRELISILEVANDLNSQGYPASLGFDIEANAFIVKSKIRLVDYGLVINNNEAPDNHPGFFYAFEAAKEHILATARMSSSAISKITQLGWIPS